MKNLGITLAVLGGGSVATSFLRQFAEQVEIAGGTSVKWVKYLTQIDHQVPDKHINMTAHQIS